jgi:hypothetical protein
MCLAPGEQPEVLSLKFISATRYPRGGSRVETKTRLLIWRHFAEFSFRKTVSRKSPDTFCLREKNAMFSNNSKSFQTDALSRKPARISCHQNILTKMVPLFHILLTKFFPRNLSQSRLLLIFATIFANMRKHKFSFQTLAGYGHLKQPKNYI